MENKYDAPELTLIGEADLIIMGAGGGVDDFMQQAAPDFEFEQDYYFDN